MIASADKLVPSVLIYVIKPIVSPSISIPWYNLWAICIVLDAPNPNLLDATCWSVEVVKGPEGFLLIILDEISLILKSLFLTLSIASLISLLFLNENFSILFPFNWEMLAVIELFFSFWNFTLKVQNSSGSKDSISCSLSVISFKATDWTLPADFDPGNFVQSIGEILKPTK